MDKQKLTVWIAAALAAGMLIIALASMQDAKAATWTGCYGSASAGYGSTNTEADLNITGLGGVTIDGLGADGATLSLGAGCDLQMQKIVIGAFGDWTWHDDSEFTISANVPGFSGDIASYAVDDEWTIGARAGYLVHDAVLVYALVGYTEASFTDLDVLGGLGGPSFAIPDMDGIVWGGGAEVALGNGLSLKGEYRYADYDAETVEIIPGALDLDMNPDIQSARVGLVYKFNFTSDASSPMK